MSSLLLDTHIALWSVAATHLLPLSGRRLIEENTEEIFFSSVSIWELAIKAKAKRPGFEIDPAALYRELLRDGFKELPVRSNHALAAADLPHIHEDPFDRLLIGQAVTENLILVTSDQLLPRYGNAVFLV